MTVEKAKQVAPRNLRQQNCQLGLINKSAVVEELPNRHANGLASDSALGFDDKFRLWVIEVRAAAALHRWALF